MSHTTIRTRPLVTRKVAAACGAAVLLLTASACGSDNKDGNNANATGQSNEQGGPQTQQGGPDGRFPGASGRVAAVDGSTAQVQGMDGQVAVTWTASTTFTKQVSAALSDVKVGDCVLVGSDDAASADSTTPATEVTAASVRITPKTNGSCGLGARGPGGSDSGPQLNGTPPSGAPDGGTRPQIRGIGGAVGEVTAVSATGFTVDSAMPSSDDPSSTEKTSVAVTVDGDTTYTTMADGAASDVKVGICVQAGGTTDDTGAVTAKTVAVSPPQDGQCGGVMRFQSPDGGAATQQES
jgi:hypothetical protein